MKNKKKVLKILLNSFLSVFLNKRKKLFVFLKIKNFIN